MSHSHKKNCGSDCHDDPCNARRFSLSEGRAGIQVDDDTDIPNDVRQVHVTEEGVTLTLPENPGEGFTVDVLATDGAVIVESGDSPFCSGAERVSVAACDIATFIFGANCTWLFRGATAA